MLPAPPPVRPHYALQLEVKPRTGKVTGRVAVRFTPNRRVDRLVFRLWPNGPYERSRGARLTTGRITASVPLTPRRENATTLVLALARPVAAGAPITVTIPFTTVVKGRGLDRLSRSSNGVILGSFFPLLAWDPRSGWLLDPPSTGPAETWTSPIADVDATISVPRGDAVLATGVRGRRDHWHATAVRDFALAAGRFSTASRIVDAPRPVRVTIGLEHGLAPALRADALRRASTALVGLSRRYGRYAWPTYSVVLFKSLARSGIEYPNIVFQGPASLVRATTHEAGHQWFYSLVGNDQARDPWLDEGLATWSSSRVDGSTALFNGIHLGDAARGHLGAPMSYWDAHPNDFFPGVYAQGVQALASLGNDDRVDCALRSYVAQNAYRTARPADLIAALRRFFPNVQSLLRPFLGG